MKLIFEWLELHKEELIANWKRCQNEDIPNKIKPLNEDIMDLIWVTEARYITDYKIMLIFNDGIQGIIDLKNSIKGKIFKPLRDIEYFKSFRQNKWTIKWDCEADFAPEYLYKLAKKEEYKIYNKI